LFRQRQGVLDNAQGMSMTCTRRSLFAGIVGVAFVVSALAAPSKTDPQADRAAALGLRRLTFQGSATRQLNDNAIAVLVFPGIVKAGFLRGGAYGEGVLRQGNATPAYYNSAAASYGLRAGVQSFGNPLFFVNAGALKYPDASRGFEIGAGPSSVVDQGFAKGFGSTAPTRITDTWRHIIS
jgi:lipid-binding SYLF domain-containing protein